MYELLDEFAWTWLEKVLWPMAMQAAALPPETTVDDIQRLNLPQFNEGYLDDFVVREARGNCYRRPLFMAMLLATQLADNEQAEPMKAGIKSLMWRDAVEYSIANYLDNCTNGEGIPDTEFRNRACLADDRWNAWEATDKSMQTALVAMLEDYTYDMVWNDINTPENRLLTARQMKADGRSMKAICQYTGLSQAEFEQL